MLAIAARNKTQTKILCKNGRAVFNRVNEVHINKMHISLAPVCDIKKKNCFKEIIAEHNQLCELLYIYLNQMEINN